MKIYFADENFSDWHLPRRIYPVHKNGIYNNSLWSFPSAEGIFLYFKMCSLDMEIYFTRTLIFQINGKRKESILHWSICRGVINGPFFFINIATSAVNFVGILLPRMVPSISFWEQCSRAPPLFAPLPPGMVFDLWVRQTY